MSRQYRLADGLHNVPDFLMGRMVPEEARRHLDFLEREFPQEMAAAREALRQYQDRRYEEDSWSCK